MVRRGGRPFYDFSGAGEGENCFTADLVTASERGPERSPEDVKSARIRLAAYFAATRPAAIFTNVAPSDVDELAPAVQRGDLFGAKGKFPRTLASLSTTGPISDGRPLLVPRWATESGLVADGSPGLVNRRDGSFTTAGGTLTPVSFSGRVTVDRELIDSGRFAAVRRDRRCGVAERGQRKARGADGGPVGCAVVDGGVGGGCGCRFGGAAAGSAGDAAACAWWCGAIIAGAERGAVRGSGGCVRISVGRCCTIDANGVLGIWAGRVSARGRSARIATCTTRPRSCSCRGCKSCGSIRSTSRRWCSVMWGYCVELVTEIPSVAMTRLDYAGV